VTWVDNTGYAYHYSEYPGQAFDDDAGYYKACQGNDYRQFHGYVPYPSYGRTLDKVRILVTKHSDGRYAVFNQIGLYNYDE
jgi:hypothetical protein